jgi:peptidoglycan/LPS O-acetylase OafA/YrhL
MLKKSSHYLISLDLFRGFCGYGVAITHLNAFAFDNSYMEYMSLIFAEFFFVLSGFVLYPQLLKVINNNKNLIIFYKRRWMRTLPLFIVVLILISTLIYKFFEEPIMKLRPKIL